VSEKKDIVEELRLRAEYLQEGSCYARAADEIERLRKENEFLHHELGVCAGKFFRAMRQERATEAP
jgi:hypothetical protein